MTTIASLHASYAAGTTVTEVVERALEALGDDRSPAVLIGGPLAAHAMADVARLADLDPAWLPLYGVPFLVKDNIDVAGIPTTAGCPSFATVPEEDATAVARLRAAGAIVVGKANLDQFATGLVGTRSPYGTPCNTLDPGLVPGGSSSGSAVAVASGAVAFALGTDTAGSGRVPAALNRIVGLKPTVGRVSTAGVVPAVRRIDCVSVFARTVGDARLVAALAAGPDPRDPFTRRPPDNERRSVRTVGVVPPPFALDPGAAAAFEADVAALRAGGLEVRPVDAGFLFEAGELLYGGPLVAERYAAVGHAVDGRADLDPTVATIIGGGARWTAVDAYRAEYRLAELRALVAALWLEVDALALPVHGHAPTLEEVAADPIGTNADLGRLTTFVNLLDLVAVVVPSAAAGPYGLQLVGPAWSDDEVAAAAARAVGEPPVAAATSTVPLVVVGAHLRGQPLNHQLLDAGAWFVASTNTAPSYRLFALAGTVPPKPGLLRVPEGGQAIEVEVWDLPVSGFGAVVAKVPPPLCIGSVELEDGSWCHGFLCEPYAVEGARDITHHRGWRGYLASAPPS